MIQTSPLERTTTWNPIARLISGENGKAVRTNKVYLDEKAIELPAKWTEPHSILVNPAIDLFGESIPIPWLLRIFNAMQRAPWHRYYVLTNCSDRLLKMSPRLPWIPNIWMGVGIQDNRFRFRIDNLRATGAHVKFLVLEPLGSDLPNLDLKNIDWVIVGGDSGPGVQPVKVDWVRSIRDQCAAANVPFFFKHWGGSRKKRSDRILDGRTWDEMPCALQSA